MDLLKPEYGDGQIGQVIAPSGGTTWTRIMFERQVLGEDYWARHAANKPRLYPSGAPLSDALVRGEVAIAPLIYNIIYPKQRDGAPVATFFPPEGVPIVPYASGIPKTAQSPNAARLYMDWLLSDEGQVYSIRQHGNMTSLKNPPLMPEGFDQKTTKVWVPNFEQFETLNVKWIEEWNRTFGYRQ
jgi:iron(III) transport system substrate-binding protein